MKVNKTCHVAVIKCLQSFTIVIMIDDRVIVEILHIHGFTKKNRRDVAID